MLPNLLAEIFPANPYHLLVQRFEYSRGSEGGADGRTAHQIDTPGGAGEKLELPSRLPRCFRKERELSDFTGYGPKGQVVEF
jgi:hypothetical protein